MSNSTSIKLLLDIQDPNINFDEECVKEETYKGEKCNYISGKLTYTPHIVRNVV